VNTDHVIAAFMRYGALAAVILCVVGSALLTLDGGLPTHAQLSSLDGVDYCRWFETLHVGWVALAGLALLVVVSVGRLILCAVLFLGEGDFRFAIMSLLAVILVAVAVVFRLV